jgi:hypothetical protein
MLTTILFRTLLVLKASWTQHCQYCGKCLKKEDQTSKTVHVNYSPEMEIIQHTSSLLNLHVMISLSANFGVAFLESCLLHSNI